MRKSPKSGNIRAGEQGLAVGFRKALGAYDFTVCFAQSQALVIKLAKHDNLIH
jgi:hypothetical protein